MKDRMGAWRVTSGMPLPAEIAHGLVDDLIEDFRDPKFRAEFFTSAIASVACARAGLRFLPSLAIAVAVGYAAGWAYESVEDIRAKLGGSDAAGGV